MEEALGRRLFDRTTRRVQLTPTGSELRPIAERLIAEFDTALGDFAQFLEGRRGRVVIAALPSISAVLLPGAIARFLEDNASVVFQIRDGLSGTVVETVVSGKADMGLTVHPRPAENLSYRALAADAFGLVCRPDHPLAREASAPWTAFANEPFIRMDQQSSARDGGRRVPAGRDRGAAAPRMRVPRDDQQSRRPGTGHHGAAAADAADDRRARPRMAAARVAIASGVASFSSTFGDNQRLTLPDLIDPDIRLTCMGSCHCETSGTPEDNRGRDGLFVSKIRDHALCLAI